MALYIPTARRRQSLLLMATSTLVIGLGVGTFAGRVSVPDVSDRVSSVQTQARATSSGLRVLTLHEQNKLPNSGADLTLAQTRTELESEFGKAPWIGASVRKNLLASLDGLTAIADRSSTPFANAADSLAREIDAAFGIS